MKVWPRCCSLSLTKSVRSATRIAVANTRGKRALRCQGLNWAADFNGSRTTKVPMSQHFRRIEQLRGWRQTVFLLALAERSYPNFAMFGQLSGQVNHELLRRTPDALWEDFSDRVSSQQYRQNTEMS